MKKTIICLIGPTAVGKTEVGLKLARQLSAEIISCDSMQIYKGLDIASSKPTSFQRKQIPHHFIDIVRPSQEYNAARFRTSAEKAIRQIHKRAKTPLILAGTGLYLRALLDGLFVGPGQNRTLRNKFQRLAKRYGPSYLYRRLERLDPQAAGKIHCNDIRRIIRALEVCHLTGEPISKLQTKVRGIRDNYRVCMFGLTRPREQLYQRINKRVDQMFKRGLVAEIRKVSRSRLSKTAKSLLGYKEVKGFIDGENSHAEAKQLLKRNTRHYAKRQLSWFAKEKDVSWIEITASGTPTQVAKRILRLLA
ncbi:MAG: tRNA (adenosine(37)-N6)-dimethylallyltransferase MiaA [Candidatus Omnitrophica bacterium]|nr:tRNA (adenosine(37)-N6)-dimethylallyltransferase MiaA [Candidatus Omnitrophota bacterium]